MQANIERAYSIVEKNTQSSRWCYLMACSERITTRSLRDIPVLWVAGLRSTAGDDQRRPVAARVYRQENPLV
jgi:hypothetical protein